MLKKISGIFVFATSMIFAQESGSNIIKTNIPAYAFRNVNLSFEHIFSKRFSVVAGAGFMLKGGIPMESTFNDNENLNTGDASVSGTMLTLEPRIYLGKNGYGEGFYLSSYFRYSQFKVDDVIYTYKGSYENIGYEIPLNFNGEIHGASGGLLAGYQWFFGRDKNWALDAFVGAHYGGGGGNAFGRSPVPMMPQQQQQVQHEIENLDIPIVKIKATVHENGADADLSGPWAGARAGLAIGYRF